MSFEKLTLPEQLSYTRHMVDCTKQAVANSGFIDTNNIVELALMGVIGAKDEDSPEGAGMHVLIEGPSGNGKTTMVKKIGSVISAKFVRIQGNPDLTSSDITGSDVWNESKREFDVMPGQLVGKNIALVDEFNRMSPKSNAGVLEAMAEGNVTIGATGNTLSLDKFFTVFATQNPVTQDGTQPVSAAVLDRFSIWIPFSKGPGKEKALRLAKSNSSKRLIANTVNPEDVLNREKILQIRDAIDRLSVPDEVAEFVDSVNERFFAEQQEINKRGDINQVDSTRSLVSLMRLTRICGALHGRLSANYDDFAMIAPYVLGKFMFTGKRDALPMEKFEATNSLLSDYGVPQGTLRR